MTKAKKKGGLTEKDGRITEDFFEPEPKFVNDYKKAQESIPRDRFRQPRNLRQNL